MKVIAYYTGKPQYTFLSKLLMESLDKFNLNYSVDSISSKGSWLSNCAQKPLFILNKMLELKEDVFYTDVDSMFSREPELFSNGMLDKVHAAIPYWEKTGEILSGSMYFKFCPETLIFLKAWVDNQTNDVMDQKVLQKTLKDYETKIKILTLPLEYCKIYDSMQEIENPVITHYQASRNYRE